jgi:hypothetical protein
MDVHPTPAHLWNHKGMSGRNSISFGPVVTEQLQCDRGLNVALVAQLRVPQLCHSPAAGTWTTQQRSVTRCCQLGAPQAACPVSADASLITTPSVHMHRLSRAQLVHQDEEDTAGRGGRKQ